MHALSDEQRIEALEAKVGEGFARMDQGFIQVREELREMRQDLREVRGQSTTWGVAVLAMWLTIILGFAGIIIAMITQF